MNWSRSALLGLLTSVLACACGEPAPQREWTPADHAHAPGDAQDPDRTPAEPVAPATPSESIARAAAALWNASCASCHGREGRGDGAARPPGAQIPDFTAAAWQASRSDAQLVQAIRDGRGMMPGFGKQVNEHGISALVEHIRRMDPAKAPAPSAPSDAQPPR